MGIFKIATGCFIMLVVFWGVKSCIDSLNENEARITRICLLNPSYVSQCTELLKLHGIEISSVPPSARAAPYVSSFPVAPMPAKITPCDYKLNPEHHVYERVCGEALKRKYPIEKAASTAQERREQNY